MKLRLKVTGQCLKNCEGCCNKDWPSIPVFNKVFTDYTQILITGGEPMFFPNKLARLIKDLKPLGIPIYVYTAKVDDLAQAMRILCLADGITLTLHTQEDVVNFYRFQDSIGQYLYESKSLRLNIFKGVQANYRKTWWKTRHDIEWIKNCPLPADEEFFSIFPEMWAKKNKFGRL